MREGSMDRVLEKVTQRYDRVANLMTQQFKGIKPFATEQFTPEQKIWAVDNLGYDDMTDLVNEFGMDSVGYMLSQIEKSRQDGRRRK